MPKPTAEAIAEALIQYETNGMCHYGRVCGTCDCYLSSKTQLEKQMSWAMELDRAHAVRKLL